MKTIRLSITIAGERFDYITPQDLVSRLEERIKEIDSELVKMSALKKLRREVAQTLKQYTGECFDTTTGGGGTVKEG